MQEEILWFPKYRSKQVAFGDCNTKFLRGATAICHCKNKIDTIQDDDENQTTYKEELSRDVPSFCKNIFSDEEEFD